MVIEKKIQFIQMINTLETVQLFISIKLLLNVHENVMVMQSIGKKIISYSADTAVLC